MIIQNNIHIDFYILSVCIKCKMQNINTNIKYMKY